MRLSGADAADLLTVVAEPPDVEALRTEAMALRGPAGRGRGHVRHW
jgi:hypothetical protein